MVEIGLVAVLPVSDRPEKETEFQPLGTGSEVAVVTVLKSKLASNPSSKPIH